MKTPKLLTWYESVLKAADASVDEKGFIFLNRGATPIPGYVEDSEGNQKQMALPTDIILSEHYAETIRFHPLSEDFRKGPSKVVEQYKEWVVDNVSTTMIATIIALLELCASDALHSKLTPVQSELLKVAKNAKQSTIDTFKKLISKITFEDTEFQMFRVFLKQKANINGTAYHWGGMVNFPFYEQLKACDKKLKSVTISGENKQTLLDVFRYLYPKIDTVHAYSYGSNSNLAPKFEAILGAIKNVAIEINGLIDELGNQNQDIDQIDLEWADYLENTDIFHSEIRMIPMQPGNEGAISKLEKGFVPLDQANQTNPSTPNNEVRQQTPASSAPTISSLGGITAPPPQPIQQTQPVMQAVQQARTVSKLSDIFGGASMAPPQPMMAVMPTPGLPVQQPAMGQPQIVQTQQGPMVVFNGQLISYQQWQMMMMSGQNAVQNPYQSYSHQQALNPIGRATLSGAGR